jgi:hypothetical protein
MTSGRPLVSYVYTIITMKKQGDPYKGYPELRLLRKNNK